jgi:glycosyltransferase involved in cell wall biosynthesis
MQREFPGLRVKVLGNVVRTDFFTPSPEGMPGRFRFAALALMEKAKGLDILLHAARKLLDSGREDFHIAIGGDGSERRHLEHIARDSRLGDHVEFLGLLDRFQVRALLQRADAFVLPSLGETFSLAVAEAMACGKPVVATRCGGPEFVVGPDDGILVAPGDPDALASGMRAVCDATGKWSPAAIRHSVESRFGPAAFRIALSDIYAGVLGAAGL